MVQNRKVWKSWRCLTPPKPPLQNPEILSWAFVTLWSGLVWSLSHCDMEGGGRVLGMLQHCCLALERTSQACIYTSSLVARHLCHVFVGPRWWFRHQMGPFQSSLLTLTCAESFYFTVGWECRATDVDLECKHLKAKGRIFGYPVWEVTSFWLKPAVWPPQPPPLLEMHRSPSTSGIKKHFCDHQLNLKVGLCTVSAVESPVARWFRNAVGEGHV